MKEEDIRPAHLLNEYLRLSAQDADTCFSDCKRQSITCVACGAAEYDLAFEKNGFAYVECQECGSLYLNPRPHKLTFDRFYKDSVSSRYWADTFFPAVAEARRESIFRPRAAKLADICHERKLKPGTTIDVGAGYGIFLDEWRAIYPESKCIAVEPSQSLAGICRDRGFEVDESVVEDVIEYSNAADLLTCFEVFEHVHDPLAFLQSLTKLVRPGGLLLISTLGVDGFDIQVLWEKSKSIFPPHHINFLSHSGFSRLFGKAGLEDVEITTPGVLDVDIVRNAAAVDSSILTGNRFIEKLTSDARQSTLFQQFLSENKLSSHTWIFARKRL